MNPSETTLKILNSVAELKAWRISLEQNGKPSLGFVPTLGALHAGHQSLLEKARSENEQVCLSIFVNPTQFNSQDDFDNYPKTLEQDLEIAKTSGVDAVFIPRHPQELYPDGFRFKVQETDFSTQLCGAHRPGHFDGVLSVVLKLLMLTRPRVAYFGEKDYQQLTLIRGMATAFFLETEIQGCPTLREKDGLAMSSRNLRLTSEERALAPALYAALSTEKDLYAAGEKLTQLGFKVEYLQETSTRRYVAAWLGKVRLIDNVRI